MLTYHVAKNRSTPTFDILIRERHVPHRIPAAKATSVISSETAMPLSRKDASLRLRKLKSN
jgi:hypothetical protein